MVHPRGRLKKMASSFPFTLVHLGFHKTATTLLQKHYFTQEFGFHQMEPQEVISLLVEKFSTDGLGRGDQEKIAAATQEADASGLQLVLSHERLSGHPFSGAYDRDAILRRVGQITPRAKIMVVFREQCDWIYSMWKQSIVDGADISLDQFLSQTQHQSRRMPSFSFDVVDYNRLYDRLCADFGTENVLFLPFELLRKNEDAFLQRLADFSQQQHSLDGFRAVSVNASKSMAHIWAIRLAHRLLFQTAFSTAGLIPVAMPIKSRSYRMVMRALRPLSRLRLFDGVIPAQKHKTKQAVGDYFDHANRELGEKIGIDLAQFGYGTGSTR